MKRSSYVHDSSLYVSELHNTSDTTHKTIFNKSYYYSLQFTYILNKIVTHCYHDVFAFLPQKIFYFIGDELADKISLKIDIGNQKLAICSLPFLGNLRAEVFSDISGPLAHLKVQLSILLLSITKVGRNLIKLNALNFV